MTDKKRSFSLANEKESEYKTKSTNKKSFTIADD
jgi:hypothetical protein